MLTLREPRRAGEFKERTGEFEELLSFQRTPCLVKSIFAARVFRLTGDKLGALATFKVEIWDAAATQMLASSDCEAISGNDAWSADALAVQTKALTRAEQRLLASQAFAAYRARVEALSIGDAIAPAQSSLRARL